MRKFHGIRISGIIVETEAYHGFDDTACHAHKGLTERCKVMYGEAGHAYVYFTYGLFNMLNLVTMGKGFPGAVLIRAVQPVEGINFMFKKRLKASKDTDLASGPGKLTQAFSIDRKLNGANLTRGKKIWVEEYDFSKFKIVKSSRIGVDYAGKAKHWEWRYFIGGNEFVSKR